MAEEQVTVFTDGAELRMFRDPKQILGEAALVGTAVAALVRKNPDLVKVIGGRKHPRFELLQIVATMFRVTARAKETRHIMMEGVEGWECDAEAYHIPTSQIVATAQAMCLNDEPNWDTRPEYEYKEGKKILVGTAKVPTFQRRSMAQTRACSKALRLAIGWVLGMAGYEATPAEEMTGTESHEPQSNGQASNGPQRKSGGTGTISEAQENRLYAIAKNAGKSKDALGVILAHFGFPDGSATVTRDKYDAICAEILK